jgi:hypothetical protein
MEKLKAFLKGKDFQRFLWNTLYGFIGLGVVYVSGESWLYAPIIIALLNGASKAIYNKTQE